MSTLFQNYARRKLHLVKGQGARVTDANGKTYLDFLSGIAVNALGHCHPIIVNALQKQSEQLWHVSNIFEQPAQEQLAKKLIHSTSLTRAFFCNSGAEANEAALKLARKHTGKHVVITFEQSFHGRTFGAMSATGQDKVKKGFGPLLPEFRTIPFNDCEALRQAATEDVAAILLETIQGEGGVNEVSESFAQFITTICQEQGILLIVDEIQTGIGRTGTPYAYQQTALKPDIITLAKGLGGGFPIGAMLGVEALAQSFGPGSHGTTFGGNPLAVAVAQAVVDKVLEPSFLQQVQQQGVYLQEQLKVYLPKEQYQVKGKGLLQGIQCQTDVAPFVEQLQEAGLLVVQAGAKVIRLLPPLNVTKEEIDEAVERLTSVLVAP